MRIDYSKWDLLDTLGWLGQEKSGYTDMMKSHAGCHKCKTLLPESKMKTCSRCEYRFYCSKECQRQDWPSHKKECTPTNKAASALLDQMQKSAEILMSTLRAYSSRPLFRGGVVERSTQDTQQVAVRAKDQPDELFDLASLVKDMQTNHDLGQGVFFLSFGNCEECETFIIALCAALQGSVPLEEHPILPLIEFVPYPSPREESVNNVVSMLKEGEEFGLGVSIGIRRTKGGIPLFKPKEAMLMAMPVNYHSKKLENEPAPLPAFFPNSTVSFAFARELENSDMCLYCQAAMAILQNRRGPGVLWLRNITRPGQDAYHRKDLKNGIAQEDVEEAIMDQAALESPDEGDQNATALFLTYDTVQETFHHPIIAKHWPSVVNHRRKEIMDPNIVLGFMLTYLHSNSTKCIVSEFQVLISNEKVQEIIDYDEIFNFLLERFLLENRPQHRRIDRPAKLRQRLLLPPK